jgi:hypothetical protein
VLVVLIAVMVADSIGSSLTVYGADHADTVSGSSQDELAETG